VTVLIDEPRWHFEGRTWSHLVSDQSLDELHEFAQRMGIPLRGLHGDHYDVPQEWYDTAVELGAVPTSSRELVRRLREAGLRMTPRERRGHH
jgi:Mn-dependent DtxR family transcriptional regulator